MTQTRIDSALRISGEEQSAIFERFANAFLLPDYPELKALGGKHDAGMDARLHFDDSDSLQLVVQSCVSPADKARTKILATVAKLATTGREPRTLIYCTSASIGLRLDDTKKEVRTQHGIHLEVCDRQWFVGLDHRSGQPVLMRTGATCLYA